jgi:hypothetical protein
MPKGYPSPEIIAAHAADIATWWARCDTHKRYYTPKELEQIFGVSMRALAGGLELAGWRRKLVWARRANRRVRLTFWVPPGGRAPVPARGRPCLVLVPTG